jgi:hypothetical protein
MNLKNGDTEASGFLRVLWASLIMEPLQLGVRRSHGPEDHLSKSVELTSRER